MTRPRAPKSFTTKDLMFGFLSSYFNDDLAIDLGQLGFGGGNAVAALAEHRSQVARGAFQRLVRGRAEAASVLGPELLYGFGLQAPDEPYAELLCEVALHDGLWLAGRERRLDPADPLGGADAFHPHMPAASWVR